MRKNYQAQQSPSCFFPPCHFHCISASLDFSYPTEETTGREHPAGPKPAHLARESLTVQHEPGLGDRDFSCQLPTRAEGVPAKVENQKVSEK